MSNWFSRLILRRRFDDDDFGDETEVNGIGLENDEWSSAFGESGCTNVVHLGASDDRSLSDEPSELNAPGLAA